MSIAIENLLPPDLRQAVIDVHNTLNEIEPVAETLLSEGFPVQPQVDAFKERRAWNEKMLRLFKITPMTQT